MSDVKPSEYLIGIGGYIFFICMAGACVFAAVGQYRGEMLAAFLLIMAVGIAASLLAGAAVGTWSKNQMMATSISVPVMMVFSFVSMLSMFNETIRKAAKYFYSEQINILLNCLGGKTTGLAGALRAENALIIALNMAAALGCFIFAYRKSGLS
ncbi:MAG: ABC transporter permease [Bacillus sp. (in: Bacteria)]|nr:ABC transporter permease [Bacillus sp. (in: firmicutes)]MCM1427706.1 ABC transporter permease [Eubacterium sp.]